MNFFIIVFSTFAILLIYFIIYFIPENIKESNEELTELKNDINQLRYELKISQDEELRNKIKRKLYKLAAKLAQKEHLNIYRIHSSSAAGQYAYYKKDSMEYTYSKCFRNGKSLKTIKHSIYDYPRINLKYRSITESYDVLAHELGHHFLVHNKDNNEINADKFSLYFVLKNLNSFEKWVMSGHINTYFKTCGYNERVVNLRLNKHLKRMKEDKEYRDTLNGDIKFFERVSCYI
jgi:hypothetical protein